MNTVIIKETTQGELESTLVGVGNIGKRDVKYGDIYSEKMSAMIFIKNFRAIVWEGVTLKINGSFWRVNSIDDNINKLSSVTFIKIDPIRATSADETFIIDVNND